MTTDVHLRPLRSDDVATAVELLAAAHPSDIRHRLAEQLAPGAATGPRRTVIAEVGGAVVGAAKLAVEPMYPEALAVLVAVMDEWRGRGIGSQLGNAIMSEVSALDGYALTTCALRDDSAAGRRFAERYGLVVSHHSIGLECPVSGRGDALSEQAAEAAAVAGVRIRRASFEDDEEVLFECVGRCMEGLPMPFGAVDLQGSAQYLPKNAVILLAENAVGSPRACGLTIGGPQTGTDSWYTHFSAVASDARRRGVATALKTALLSFAERAGAPAVLTHNDEANEPILKLNRKLGMTPAVGYWVLTRTRVPGDA
ncbi:GNAT family N-acetyltransferase [Pseudonocardia xinjiangensis]|uniref:GNAT family N-acetyltransferase n=1 Tax=Pseudonocardia xinjiangensis TaxID=75289 RepID=UPI003D9310C7